MSVLSVPSPVIRLQSSTQPVARSNQNLVPLGPVEIGIALDHSSSMGGYKAEVITGYNALITEQKALSLETKVSLTLFNSEITIPYTGCDIAAVEPLISTAYLPQGGTALYDGIVATIDCIARRVDNLAANPPRVVVAIVSDGAENSSTVQTLAMVKDHIVYRQKGCGWLFLFLGPHAAKTAYQLGIPVSNALAITTNKAGIAQALSRLGKALAKVRLGQSNDVFRLK